MNKSNTSDINAIMLSVALGLFSISFYVIFSGYIVPIALILIISIFTLFISLADFLNLAASSDDENENKRIRVLRFSTISLSIPFGIFFFAMLIYKGRSEEQLGNIANAFTLIALSFLLISLIFKNSNIQNKDKKIENQITNGDEVIEKREKDSK